MGMNGCVIFSKDMKAMSAFYQATLNMKIRDSSDLYIALGNDHYELLIHPISEDIASTITIESPPKLRGNTAVKLVFGVDSLSAVRKACKLTGGGLKGEAHSWEFNGCKVVDGWDPEGNVIQFRQSVPS